ncbi:MAG: hypothetical protein JWO77_111 [Ilumatobacteraceae bacterium]|nr:hypothetical protein [Ilumatobacteraceae bacterium]
MTPIGTARSGGDADGIPAPAGGPGAPAPQLSRRAVIGGLAASGLTAGMVGSLLSACTDGSASDGSETSGATEAERAVIRLGRRYRADHPDEDDRDVLLERLGVAAGVAGSLRFLSTLDAQVAEDYASGRTVRLDGWVLSQTEGRAAALVSLA